MAVVYDVPATLLINKAAQKLKESGKIVPPEWAGDVKTGVHRQRPPAQPDWWYTRCASVLEDLYRRSRGCAEAKVIVWRQKEQGRSPDRHERAGGAIIRNSLQQLEKAGYVKSVREGRVVTPAGMSFLDKVATEVVSEKKVQA